MTLDIDLKKFQNCKKHNIKFSANMNTDIAFENLKLTASTMGQLKIGYIIYFGTLLGFIREGWFLEHDEDTDVCCIDLSETKILQLVSALENVEFELLRYTENIISFIRKGEYIDIYLFKSTGQYATCFEYKISMEDFNEPVELPIFGHPFDVPKQSEKALEKLYGSDWRIPKVNFHAPPTDELQNINRSTIKQRINNILYTKVRAVRIITKIYAPTIYSLLRIIWRAVKQPKENS